MTRDQVIVDSHGDVNVEISNQKPDELKEQHNVHLADVIVVGGGPAGLSCAMILGRSMRKVYLFDAGS